MAAAGSGGGGGGGAGSPEAAEVDRLLSVLQSADNAARAQAERQLEIWGQNPSFLQILMERSHLAASPGSRQLAATILSWRLPRLWPSLGDEDRLRVRSALLDCFGSCNEAPVLRLLGEACNATAQSIAIRQDQLWEDLLRALASLLAGPSVLHRRASLDLLSSLVESLGARLQQFYAELGRTLSACLHDADDGVRIAALGLVGTAASSWCLTDDDLQHWHGAGEATLAAASAALARPSGDASGPALLAASLRALGRLAPALRSQALAAKSAELASLFLNNASASSRYTEQCRTQALQLLRTFARSSRAAELWTEQAFAAVVPIVCASTKDAAPDLDDLDDVSLPTQAARECLRALARADPGRVLPMVLEFAREASQSVDALDRAAAVHAVSFALCGAQEASPGWAAPLAGALGDKTVWVRQAACEGAATLAESLQQSQATTEGLLVLLAALSKHLPQEPVPEVLKKAAQATSSVLRELSTDEVVSSLRGAVAGICSALGVAVRAAAAAAESAATGGPDAAEAAANADVARGAIVAVLGALAAAASTAADHFEPLAGEAASALLPLLRAGSGSGGGGDTPARLGAAVLTPAVLAACLDAAGAVVAAAWSSPDLRSAREECAGFAHRALADERAPSEVRASAHNFFASVAMASFEEFAPQLGFVVEAAVKALHASDGGDMAQGLKRAVRTGGHEERSAAIEALGAYASAVGGAAFAAQLHAVLPALCAQVRHPNGDIRAAAAGALERVGRMLDGLARGAMAAGGTDAQAASAMAQAVARAICELLAEASTLESSALRRALQAKEDLLESAGFVALLGQEASAALSGAGGGRRSEDVASSDAGDDDEDLDDAS